MNEAWSERARRTALAGALVTAVAAHAAPLTCPPQGECRVTVKVTVPAGSSRDCAIELPESVTLDDQTTSIVWELDPQGSGGDFVFGKRVAGRQLWGISFRISGLLFTPRDPKFGTKEVTRIPLLVPRRSSHEYDVNVQFTPTGGAARACNDLGPVIVNRGE